MATVTLKDLLVQRRIERESEPNILGMLNNLIQSSKSGVAGYFGAVGEPELSVPSWAPGVPATPLAPDQVPSAAAGPTMWMPTQFGSPSQPAAPTTTPAAQTPQAPATPRAARALRNAQVAQHEAELIAIEEAQKQAATQGKEALGSVQLRVPDNLRMGPSASSQIAMPPAWMAPLQQLRDANMALASQPEPPKITMGSDGRIQADVSNQDFQYMANLMAKGREFDQMLAQRDAQLAQQQQMSQANPLIHALGLLSANIAQQPNMPGIVQAMGRTAAQMHAESAPEVIDRQRRDILAQRMGLMKDEGDLVTKLKNAEVNEVYKQNLAASLEDKAREARYRGSMNIVKNTPEGGGYSKQFFLNRQHTEEEAEELAAQSVAAGRAKQVLTEVKKTLASAASVTASSRARNVASNEAYRAARIGIMRDAVAKAGSGGAVDRKAVAAAARDLTSHADRAGKAVREIDDDIEKLGSQVTKYRIDLGNMITAPPEGKAPAEEAVRLLEARISERMQQRQALVADHEAARAAAEAARKFEESLRAGVAPAAPPPAGTPASAPTEKQPSKRAAVRSITVE